MSWYSTGTVNVTNGSPNVTGVGTAWLAAIAAGWGFVGPDGRTYQVLSVNSDNSLTLARNYAGTSLTGQQYDLFPTQGFLRTLLTSIQGLISSVTAMLTGAGAGRFADGTAAAPGISFASDIDLGFYRVASNTLGMATGGVLRAVLDGSGRLGIGTTAPAGPLSVVTSSADGTTMVSLRWNGARELWAHEPGGNARPLVIRAQTLEYADDSGTRLAVDAAGKVAIGTTSPSQALHVNGGLQFGPAAMASALGGGIISYDAPVTRHIVGDGTGYSLCFSKRVGGVTTDLVTVGDTGNVGIGGVSPNLGGYPRLLSLAASGTYAGLELSGSIGGAIDFQTNQSTRQVQMLGNAFGLSVLTNGGSGLVTRLFLPAGGGMTLFNVDSVPGNGSLYMEGGALKFKGGSGTITTLAPA